MNKLYYTLAIILQVVILVWFIFRPTADVILLDIDVEICNETDTTHIEYPYELKTELSSDHKFSTFSNTLLDL